MNFKEDVKKYLGIDLSDYQIELFKTYFSFLIEYNKITNLTRIVDETDVYYKHFYDSITLSNAIDFNSITTLCDMGAGAGFPSIPLKIIYPHLNITIVDSLGKRITFLSKLVDKLQLSDVDLIHNRVELFALSHQESYDLVTVRALGHLSLISEMGIPMVRVGGYFIAPKGLHYEIEIDEAKRTIEICGGEVTNIIKFELPYQLGQRANIIIKKKKHIKGYPRTFAQMSHKAL